MKSTAYRIRLHPRVSRDLIAIAEWVTEHSDVATADRKLAEIQGVIDSLALRPHRGSRRDEIAPGLRAIPAGRNAVVAFVVDVRHVEVLIYAVSYGGGDWITRTRSRT